MSNFTELRNTISIIKTSDLEDVRLMHKCYKTLIKNTPHQRRFVLLKNIAAKRINTLRMEQKQ